MLSVCIPRIKGGVSTLLYVFLLYRLLRGSRGCRRVQYGWLGVTFIRESYFSGAHPKMCTLSFALEFEVFGIKIRTSKSKSFFILRKSSLQVRREMLCMVEEFFFFL